MRPRSSFDECPVPQPNLEQEQTRLTTELQLWEELWEELKREYATSPAEICRMIQYQIDCVARAYLAKKQEDGISGGDPRFLHRTLNRGRDLPDPASAQLRSFPFRALDGVWYYRPLETGEYTCCHKNCLHYIYGFNHPHELEDHNLTAQNSDQLATPWDREALQTLLSPQAGAPEYVEVSPVVATVSQPSEPGSADFLSELNSNLAACDFHTPPTYPDAIFLVHPRIDSFSPTSESPSKLSNSQNPSSANSRFNIFPLGSTANASFVLAASYSNLAKFVSDSSSQDQDNFCPTIRSSRTPKQPTTFQCNLCPKSFTRAHTLRAHLRTHTGERPFACSTCSKSFTRNDDRKRHEELHSGTRPFICKIELDASGKQWGCGMRFARADALQAHRRSETGRRCVRPLLDYWGPRRLRS